MARSFNRLKRVLSLESKQGYQNKAVVGGIRQFAIYWVEQAREEAVDEADRAFVEQTAEVLMEYSRLPGAEARSKAIESLKSRLQRREKRLAQRETPTSAPEGAPIEPMPPPPSPEAQKLSREEPVPAPAPPVEPDPEGLSQPVTALKGIGPKIAQRLARLGAESIADLLYVFPRRYDDYTLMKPIKDLVYGEQVTIIGTIWETRARRTRNNQVLVQSVISDGTANVQATWFNQPWLAEKLKAGLQIVISGQVDQYLGRPVFNSPEWEPLDLEPLRTRRIVPVYPLTKGLNSNKMRDIMRMAVEQWSARVPDPLPESIRKRRELYNLAQALQQLHFPDSHDGLHRARKRLIFDELFLLQLGMQKHRHEWRSQPGVPLPFEPATLVRFHNSLPFELTEAQRRVIDEITTDMSRNVPMNRLLQGDVGSGKTVVAAATMLVAVSAGAQAALMAPTEILAEQHFNSLSHMLAPFDTNIRLLTGSLSTTEKEQIHVDLTAGRIKIVVGTHALIQEAVEFHNLALAVIDEQHRFGVEQRGALRNKGVQIAPDQPNPHLLVMSATPIPRTLALSMYGDLDLSILDEMPPGRQEIKTRWLQASERERAYAFVQGQVEKGRQAYLIYPLVEESDKIDAKAAVEEHGRLQKEVFPDLNVGLIHGRMKGDEKEATMRAFHQGDIDILVATSVIEVGVDVPNSTVMLIEDADRFGLAQLHQFRGRVGRGQHQSYCLLIADEQTSADAEERLRALEYTNDGFELAEKDLELRGPGEFFGRRQSGLPELQLASLLDMEIVEMARAEAESLFAVDPLLQKPEHQLLQERVAEFWEGAADVS